MGILARILVLFLLLVPGAKGETIQGYDVLGLAKYCDRFLATAPTLPAVSVLLNTFGDPMPCVEAYIRKNPGKITDVQVDLVDATCWRNRVCTAGTPPLNDMNVMLQRAWIVNHYRNRNPQVRWSISPYLEHDIKSRVELQKAFDTVKHGCPKCAHVNSPMSGVSLPGVPEERHGTKVRAASVSGDGASMFDGDNLASDGNGFEHRTAGSYTTFAWFPEMNLRCTGEKKFTPVAKRTEKPTAELFRQAYLVMQPEKPVPAAPGGRCRQVVRVDGKRGEILKTNAESYCNGVPNDGRGNKPMLIISKAGRRGEKMKIYSSSGKEVGCFAYYGKYSDPKLHRWYMGGCSGQTPTQLYDSLGGEWGFADTGNGKCLLINAVRRMGTYR